MTETVTPPTASTRDPRSLAVLTEAKLIEWGIEYEYDPAVGVADLVKVQQAQVRKLEHQVDDDTIDQYATFMNQGVIFPPIVLLRETIILDGNSRVAAAKKAGKKTLAAFKCNFVNPDLAVAFAGAMNQMGGRRLSPEEARSQAEVLMRYDYEDEAIARELGYGRVHVNNWRRDREVREHAERTKISDALAKIKLNDARKLSAIKRDAPFVAVANLVAENKLPAKQVTELVKAVNDAPSEAEALNAVDDARQVSVLAGPPPQRTTLPKEMATARRTLPQLIKLEGRALALVEQDPARRQQWLADWEIVRDLAAAVIAAHG